MMLNLLLFTTARRRIMFGQTSLVVTYIGMVLLKNAFAQNMTSKMPLLAKSVPTESSKGLEIMTLNTTSECTWNTSALINDTKLYEITSESPLSHALSPSETHPVIWVAENVLNPIILLLGIGGNLLTIVIMTKKPFSDLTVSLLLTALATCDTATLVMIPLNKQNVRRVIGADIRAVSDVGCKVFFWSFRLAKVMASWVLVLISTERFTAVWLPLRAKTISTKRNALIALASIVTFLGVYFAVWTHFADRVIAGKCIPNTRTPSTQARTKAFLLFGLSLLAFIPGSIILLLNSLIAFKLWRRPAIKQCSMGKSEQGHADQGRATVMLLGVALAFLILVTPIAVAHMVFYVMDRNIFEAKEPGMVAFREIAQVLELMNSSVNFFLYVLCSKGFRHMLLKILQKPCQRSKVHPNPSVPSSVD